MKINDKIVVVSPCTVIAVSEDGSQVSVEYPDGHLDIVPSESCLPHQELQMDDWDDFYPPPWE
jgi:hypothetical protein